MPLTIHLVRHAQGYHNLSTDSHYIPDPLLTSHGESQCHALHASFPHHSRISHIVASPLRRTLHTALLGFSSTIVAKNLNVIALAELQETSSLPADTGSSIDVLRAEFASKPVDLDLIPEGWNSKTGRWAYNMQAVTVRAAEARKWLQELGEEGDVVVVTHGGFLHYLTENWEGFNESHGTGWMNTEWRSYVFNMTGSLIETEESRDRRTGKEKPPSKAGGLPSRAEDL